MGLRGAPLSDEERKELNLIAGTLIKSLGIRIKVTENRFDKLREIGYGGYAHKYLKECENDELKIKTDLTVYKQLLVIDSKLGTTQSEQLRWCVRHSPRKDLIEV